MTTNAPKKIALLTDSCSDISPADLAHYNIYVVPLRILCEDGEYSDGVDITSRDIYRRLENGELPKTSLPTAGDINAVFDKIAAEGYDGVIAVMLSGGLSGTYSQSINLKHYSFTLVRKLPTLQPIPVQFRFIRQRPTFFTTASTQPHASV